MSYATATITSATPAKDLMAALNTPLTAAGLTLVESYGSPATGWYATAYGAGLFVAFATGTTTVATSPDGITWTRRTLPVAANWRAVGYGGGQFVAIAQSSAIVVTSPDGITWTQQANAASATWNSLAYSGSMWVATATSGTVAASSPDGVTWTARTITSGTWYVGYGNSQFVAVSGTQQHATSPDGITWTDRTSPPLNGGQLAYSGTMFVSCSNSGSGMMSSPTGNTGTWTTRSSTLTSGLVWQAVTYGAGQFVALAQLANLAATSPDGITWTMRTLPVAGNWRAVTYGAGLFAAVANDTGITVTSADGITWTAATLTTTNFSAMADVYKSPAAGNQAGVDWYLILSRATDLGTILSYQVAEGYNATTHRASNYGGCGVNVIPTPGTYANPLPAAAPDIIAAASASLTLTTAAFTYWVSVIGNRLILGVKTSVELGFYAGLYDDLLPAGVTGFPLVCARIPIGQSSGFSIGSSTLAWTTGGFTREPLQTLASDRNFEATIHNGYWAAGVAAVVPGNLTPMTSAAPLYGNPCSLSKVMVGSNRVGAVADAVRGTLIGCMTSAVSSAAGDTTTTGGKTYTRFAGPAATFGFFVDQSL